MKTKCVVVAEQARPLGPAYLTTPYIYYFMGLLLLHDSLFCCIETSLFLQFWTLPSLHPLTFISLPETCVVTGRALDGVVLEDTELTVLTRI